MFFFIFLEKNTLDIDVSIRYGLYEYEMKLKLRSSRAESNWPLWATVGQNSSAHVDRSAAAIWELLLFK